MTRLHTFLAGLALGAVAMAAIGSAGLFYLRHHPSAVITRVIDGDTVEGRPCRVCPLTSIRLAGIDAPERFTPAGKQATAFLAATIGPLPRTVTIQRLGKGKYGRTVARLRIHGTDLSTALADAGHAIKTGDSE